MNMNVKMNMNEYRHKMDTNRTRKCIFGHVYLDKEMELDMPIGNLNRHGYEYLLGQTQSGHQH
jgi:hypothetical protein